MIDPSVKYQQKCNVDIMYISLSSHLTALQLLGPSSCYITLKLRLYVIQIRINSIGTNITLGFQYIILLNINRYPYLLLKAESKVSVIHSSALASISNASKPDGSGTFPSRIHQEHFLVLPKLQRIWKIPV